MKTTPIRIILVDDHDLARESWKQILEQDGRFAIVGECDNRKDALELTRHHKPDIALIDINMEPYNGFEISQKLLMDFPDLKIIGISFNDQPGYGNYMLQLGGKGFLAKGSPLDEIITALLQVYNGGTYVSLS